MTPPHARRQPTPTTRAWPPGAPARVPARARSRCCAASASQQHPVAHVVARQPARHVRGRRLRVGLDGFRSEEHTSELQSLMRISYAVFCLKKKKKKIEQSK